MLRPEAVAPSTFRIHLASQLLDERNRGTGRLAFMSRRTPECGKLAACGATLHAKQPVLCRVESRVVWIGSAAGRVMQVAPAALVQVEQAAEPNTVGTVLAHFAPVVRAGRRGMAK